MTVDTFPEFLGAVMFTAGSGLGFLLVMKWSYGRFGLPAVAVGLILAGLVIMGVFDSATRKYDGHGPRGPP